MCKIGYPHFFVYFCSMKPFSININGQLICYTQPCVMGILNVTPDSFFEGSRKQHEKDIALRATRIMEEGGSIIDVGAFSTRPGAAEVNEEEELARLRRALTIVRKETPNAIISVDTYRPTIARACVEEFGVGIINDVSEGGITGIAGVALPQSDEEIPEMFRTVANLRVAYILMSVQPTMQTMLEAFAREVEQLRMLGVNDIILDPGYCFGKTLEQNYSLLAEAEKFTTLDLPVLIGLSRKSMMYRLLGGTANEMLNATTVLHTISLCKGANILRVHDVKEAVEAIALCEQMQRCAPQYNIQNL